MLPLRSYNFNTLAENYFHRLFKHCCCQNTKGAATCSSLSGNSTSEDRPSISIGKESDLCNESLSFLHPQYLFSPTLSLPTSPTKTSSQSSGCSNMVGPTLKRHFLLFASPHNADLASTLI